MVRHLQGNLKIQYFRENISFNFFLTTYYRWLITPTKEIFLIQGVPASDDEDEVDNKTYIKEAEQKLKKEQDELSKIDTGIAKVFLQDREKDRENLRHKAANVDPRNASRTPSAAREPTYRLRYESPVGACKLHSHERRTYTDRAFFRLCESRFYSFFVYIARYKCNKNPFLKLPFFSF